MVGKRCETGVLTSFSKVLQNGYKELYRHQTAIETSTLPTICIFKRLNPILKIICDLNTFKSAEKCPKLYIMYLG